MWLDETHGAVAGGAVFGCHEVKLVWLLFFFFNLNNTSTSRTRTAKYDL